MAKKTIYNEKRKISSAKLDDIYSKDDKFYKVEEIHSGSIWAYNQEGHLKQFDKRYFEVAFKKENDRDYLIKKNVISKHYKM